METTIRPGLLVHLATAIRGNVSYIKTDISNDLMSDGTVVNKWETVRLITNQAELERAKKVRSKACSLVRSVCSESKFGLLCPEMNEAELEQVTRAAREAVNEFNAIASVSRVEFYIMKGRVAANDEEAIRSINSEIRDLLDTMRNGVSGLDAGSIREAANKAKQLGDMLTPAARERVQEAIDAARKAARVIVKSGESAALEIDSLTLARLTDCRASFLDLDEQLLGPQAIQEEGAAIDLEVDTGVRRNIPIGEAEMQIDMSGPPLEAFSDLVTRLNLKTVG